MGRQAVLSQGPVYGEEDPVELWAWGGGVQRRPSG